MPDFYADTEKGMPALRALLERLGLDAHQGGQYVAANTEIAGGEGWLNDLTGSHDQVRATLSRWLLLLENPTMAQTAQAVARAAENYRQTDDRYRAQFDNAAELLVCYPSPAVPDRTWPAGVVAFNDVVEPSDRYVPPADYNSQFPHEPSWADALSPASMGRNAIWTATDILARLGMMERAYDPYEFVLKPVVGDWAGFRGCADVFTQVGAAAGDMAQNLYWADNCMDEAWRGNAADAFTVHVRRLAEAISTAEIPLETLAKHYEEAAAACNEFRNVAGSLISTAIDQALIVITAASAGGATAPTVVGPVIGGVVAGYEGYQLYRTIRALMDAYGMTSTIMSAIKAAMGSFGHIDGSEFQLPNFPQVYGNDSLLSDLPRP